MSPFSSICEGDTTPSATAAAATITTNEEAAAAHLEDNEAIAVAAAKQIKSPAVAAGFGSGGGGGGMLSLSLASAASWKIMCFQNVIVMLTLLLCGLATANGLKCHMCGQYNEGVGSITPCLNYSDQYAHLYLKECSKKSEKFCVKYVSELSTVRDCATECVEKEIWETQTYCCNEDGCNGSSNLEAPKLLLLMPVLFYYIYNALFTSSDNLRH